MHFLPTSSPPKMHFPSDHKSLHNCQIRLRQLTRREHKAVLRPSNQEIDTQLYSPLRLIYFATLLSSAVDLLSEADLPCSSTLPCSWSTPLWSWSTLQLYSPLQLIYSPLQLVYLAALPPLAADLLYLQHNSPSTRQYTDFPCSRSLTRQRQAETWSPSALTGACQRTRESETENESEPSLVKSFGPSSCSTQFNTKFFTLFSRSLFSRIFLWTLCPLLLSYYHTIILLIFILQLSHHHQIIIVCWM